MKTHGYCLTINNPTESDWLPYLKVDPVDPFHEMVGWKDPKKDGIISKQEFRSMHSVLHKHGIQYIIYGKESGKEGTRHYQMFVVFRRTASFTKVKKIFPRAHIEHTRGTFKEARDYCKKGGTFYEYGYDVSVCSDNIDRDLFLQSQASEESDLRADIAALSSSMEQIENAIKEQTSLLKLFVYGDPTVTNEDLERYQEFNRCVTDADYEAFRKKDKEEGRG